MVRTFFVTLLLSLIALGPLGAQQMKAMEFRDQEVKDVLLVLGELNNVSIIPDETVGGKVSYFFGSMDFEQALKLFLDSFGFVGRKEAGAWYISKIRLSVDKQAKTIHLTANNVPLQSVLRQVSTQIGKTILFDTIPNDLVSFNMEKVGYEDFLRTCIARYPDFVLDVQDAYYYLRRKQGDQAVLKPGTASKFLKVQENLWSVSADKARFKELIFDLFTLAKKEFVLLVDRDTVIENLYLSGRSFDDLLKAILLLGNADVSVNEGISYLVESQRKDLTRKLLTTVIVPLQYLSIADFQKLLPPSMNNPSQMKIEDRSNRLVFSGSTEELKPLLDFVALVDREEISPDLKRYDLKYLRTDELFPLLPQDLSSLGPQSLPGKTSFIITISQGKQRQLETLLSTVDRPAPGEAIRLRYLKVEDFMAQLPPSVNEGNFTKTKDSSLLFFKGTTEQKARLLADLQVLDLPKPQLRYEILVIKQGKGSGATLDTTWGTSPSKADDKTAIVGNLGKLLTVNLDVLADFGYSFGLDLTAALSSDQAKILADTTINGLSGEKLSFQNTETTRYTDTVVDATTGKPSTIVRELSSGLFLSFEGWISGDDMITMKIDATLSETLNKTNGTAAPSTSEKKISTNVRTKSGKPIAISGLKEERLTTVIEKTPFLGDIPLLGLLFQKSSESRQESEFMIYVIPHLEQEPSPTNQPDRATLIGQVRKAVRL